VIEDVAGDVLRDAMSELAANFAVPTEITAILESVTARAVGLIGQVDFADVLLIDGQQHQSMAPTAAVAVELDTLQIDLQEGPCLSAGAADVTVLYSDLTSEPRWPRFAAAAVQAGIQSMMSFHLYTHSTKTHGGAGGRGALNLFSRNRYEFSIEARVIGAMLATHAASALIAADRQTQFESALASRDLIGQAKGILMERFKIDAVHAFDLIAKFSQDNNMPVRGVAQRIVDSTLR
jgi:hypothetical protein